MTVVMIVINYDSSNNSSNDIVMIVVIIVVMIVITTVVKITSFLHFSPFTNSHLRVIATTPIYITLRINYYNNHYTCNHFKQLSFHILFAYIYH